jgi:hypothetical protein
MTNYDPIRIFLIFLGCLFGFMVLVIFTRWLLGLDGMYDRQTKAIKLLKEIAKKQGVADGEIKDILG